MQELSGGAPAGEAPRRIEAGPGGFDQGGPPAEDVKPWQRGPTGAAAPWQKRDDNRGGYDTRDAGPPKASGAAAPWAKERQGNDSRGGDYYGGQNQNGYNGAPSGNAAPWQQHNAPPPPPAYPNGGYSAPGYGNGYPPQQAMGAPPGLAPGLTGAGLTALLQQFSANNVPPPPPGSAPPPPPGNAPPPPPSDLPPPPPPGR